MLYNLPHTRVLLRWDFPSFPVCQIERMIHLICHWHPPVGFKVLPVIGLMDSPEDVDVGTSKLLVLVKQGIMAKR